MALKGLRKDPIVAKEFLLVVLTQWPEILVSMKRTLVIEKELDMMSRKYITAKVTAVQVIRRVPDDEAVRKFELPLG